MSYKQRNITVSLAIFSLVLAFFSVRILLMLQSGSFESSRIFKLWLTIIIITIAANILGTIIAQIVYSIIHYIRFNEEPEFIEDERDDLIELKGTKVANTMFSLGVLLSMLSFVLKQPPLVMFTALIVSGLVAQIVSDVWRLYLYRRGF